MKAKRKIFDAVDMLTGDSPAQEKIEEADGIQMLPLDKIKPFHDHPFRLYEGGRLDDMVESIREYGILNPVIVWKMEGGYEMLAGHNRLNAARLAGLKEVPAIVKEGLTEEEAYVYVIETNLIQRSFSELLPSEKAVVLSERYEKISCQGRRSDIRQEIEALSGKKSAPTCGHNVHKLKSRDDIGEEYGMTGRSIARYMRLNYLIEPLKESLDKGEIALIAAVDLSYLDEKEQKLVADQIQWGGAKVSQKVAKSLREKSGSLEEMNVAEAIAPPAGIAKTVNIKIPMETGEKFFSGKTAKERSEVVVMALEAWFSGKEAACV
jgi:ParB family chromosome partitioning protein